MSVICPRFEEEEEIALDNGLDAYNQIRNIQMSRSKSGCALTKTKRNPRIRRDYPTVKRKSLMLRS